MIRPLKLTRATPGRAAALCLAVAPLLYFFPAATGHLVLCPDDGAVQNLPYRLLAANLVLDGHLPLWNPYIFGGMPLLGAMQGGVLFPLNWLFLLLPAQAAMNAAVLIAYSLAGVGAYLYARRAGASVAGAFVTGLVWQSSGFLVAHVSHTNIIQTACLLPWLLWAIDGYGTTARRPRAALVAALVALQTFAGHPQTLAYSLLLAGAYAIHQSFRSRELRRAYLFSLVMIVAGVALAAVQILPTFELTRHSERAAATYEFFSSFALPRGFLPTFLAPYLWGGGDGGLFRAPYVGPSFYAEYAGYVGVATLALALAAPLLKRDATTTFWAGATLVCLALALGPFLPFGLNHLVYRLPLLNLFRAPARHLMEVDFALAALAGRALTFAPQARRGMRAAVPVVAAGLGVLVLTVLCVTAGRPGAIRLGREAPVSLLRAPELFLPVVLASLTAWALWRFARARRAGVALLIALVACDLGLWGRSSGWRLGPSGDAALWRALPVAAFLRGRGVESHSYRILSLPPPAGSSVPEPPRRLYDDTSLLSAQPDLYMTEGIHNAAGYDGFGLARYGRLAGDMKLWGEIVEPERSLTDGREFDLLNVAYLISTRAPADAPATPARLRECGGYAFDEQKLKGPPLTGQARVPFVVPSVAANKVALVSSLAWSAEAAQGETVGYLRLLAEDGRRFEFALRAGIDTSEWSHDRPDIVGKIRHARAPVAEREAVKTPEGDYEAYTYVTAFALPETVTLVGGEIESAAVARSPQLTLSVLGVSLIDESRKETVQLSQSWMGKRPATAIATSPPDAARWRLAAQFGDALVYENTRQLPRAWLAAGVSTQPDETSLGIIRTGFLPDGSAWDPRRTALLDATPGAGFDGIDAAGRAEIVRYEPNRIELKTRSDARTVLVLSENHYPGWRATVDGRAVEVLRVDYNLRGVLLPPGEHEVTFVYRPKSVLIGLLLSLAAGLTLSLWLLSPARFVSPQGPEDGHERHDDDEDDDR